MIKKSLSNRLNVMRSACLSSNKSFIKCRIGFSNIILHREADTPALRSCLMHPEKYIDSGTTIKDSRTTKAVVSKLDGGTPVFIKRYNNKGLKYTLKYLCRPARAFRAWKSAWSLEVCGVPTPRNIAAVSFRRLGLLGRAYLITECLDNLVDVREFYKQIQDDIGLRSEYVDNVVRMISILHENGIIHGDLKLSNIYIQRCPDNLYSFGMWDLDGTKYLKDGLSDNQRQNEMARVIASYIELGLRFGIELDQAQVENMFLDVYSRHTKVGLKGRTLSEKVKVYTTKSHERIMRNRKKADENG